MNKLITIFIVVGFILAGTPLLACTAFMASQGDTVYVGNNEDYINPLLNVSKSGVVKVTFEKGKAGIGPEMKVELKGQTFTAKKIR